MLSRKKKSAGNVPGSGVETQARPQLPTTHSIPAVLAAQSQSAGQGQGLTRNSSSSSTSLSRTNSNGSSGRLAADRKSGTLKLATVNGVKDPAPPLLPKVEDLLGGVIPKSAQANSTENDLQRRRDLKKIVHYLTDWDAVNDQSLIKLIIGLKNNVDSLDDKMVPLLQQILNGDWIRRSAKVVSQIEDFLSEVLVVRPNLWGMVMNSLISKLIPGAKVQVENEDDISIAEQNVFSVAHRNLRRIVELFPMKQENYVKTMGGLYPYMGKGVHAHFAYVTNLLEAMEYLPKVQDQLLHVLIHKLVRIDVNIQKQEIEDASTSSNAQSYTVKNEEGGHDIFTMDLDDGPVRKENPLIPTLDVCMNLMLQHFDEIFRAKAQPETDEGIGEDESTISEQQREDEQKRLTLFNSLLHVFETEILPTFGLNNVQFLYFYILSLQPSFPNTFLDFLWKKASSVNTPAVIRVQAMAYLAGILARAQFVSVKTVKRWLTRLADWANAYVNQKFKSCHWSSVKIEAHGPFYAVCQALFYVFAFRNKELIGSRKCIAFTRTLNLGRLVTSDLNPLKACQAEISDFFVKATHQHQISYCRTVLERNQRATIPTITRDNLCSLGSQSELFSSTQLEAFFPFDPIFLNKSREWITPIYREYEPYLEEVKVEKVEPTEETEDSIEMELGSYPGTPGTRTNGFYCNGIMPYKFKAEVKNELEMDSFMD